MSQWSSGDVDANGVRIHYHRTGGEKPPLVLAHGATDSGLCWTRVARALEPDYDVIMPDARGHGLSDAPEEGYTSVEHASDLAALIRGLGLQRPAVGGHSMGAGSTLRLIADYPELVSCAVLEDPGFRLGDAQPSVPDRDDPRARLRQVVADAQAQGMPATIARGKAANPTWADEEFEPWAQAKAQVRPQFFNQLNRGMMQEWRDLLPRVKCPVLLVTSDPERGGIVTPEAAREAGQLLPALQVVRLNGAGHNVRREQFDGFLEAVQRFLASVYTPETSGVA